MNVSSTASDTMDEWGDEDVDSDHEHEESELGPKVELSFEDLSAIQQLAQFEASAVALAAHVSATEEANETTSAGSSSSSSSAPAIAAVADVATPTGITGPSSSSASSTPAPTSAPLGTSASHDSHDSHGPCSDALVPVVPLNGDIPPALTLAAASLSADDVSTVVQN